MVVQLCECTEAIKFVLSVGELDVNYISIKMLKKKKGIRKMVKSKLNFYSSLQYENRQCLKVIQKNSA